MFGAMRALPILVLSVAAIAILIAASAFRVKKQDPPCRHLNTRMEHGADAPQENLAGRVEVRITVTPAEVRAGDEVLVRGSLRNVSRRPVAIRGMGHYGPEKYLEVTDAAGTVVNNPLREPPWDRMPLPEGRPGPPYRTRTTLEPGVEYCLERRWRTVQSQGSGATPTTSAGSPAPLRPGVYSIRFAWMLDFREAGLQDPVGRLVVRPRRRA
jgi:hypothetical protein